MGDPDYKGEYLNWSTCMFQMIQSQINNPSLLAWKQNPTRYVSEQITYSTTNTFQISHSTHNWIGIVDLLVTPLLMSYEAITRYATQDLFFDPSLPFGIDVMGVSFTVQAVGVNLDSDQKIGPFLVRSTPLTLRTQIYPIEKLIEPQSMGLMDTLVNSLLVDRVSSSVIGIEKLLCGTGIVSQKKSDPILSSYDVESSLDTQIETNTQVVSPQTSLICSLPRAEYMITMTQIEYVQQDPNPKMGMGQKGFVPSYGSEGQTPTVQYMVNKGFLNRIGAKQIKRFWDLQLDQQEKEISTTIPCWGMVRILVNEDWIKSLITEQLSSTESKTQIRVGLLNSTIELAVRIPISPKD